MRALTNRLLKGATAVVLGFAVPLPHGLAAECYDFEVFDAFASGAIRGQHVSQPVEGFDLLLMRDGRVVFHRAYGDWQLDRVAATDSTTKTLSGALIMSLVEDASVPLALDTRLSEHIPAFDGNKAGITIRQCFSHMAGFGYSQAVSNPWISLQEAALEIASDALEHQPGAAFRYGGTSMHAAGAVAEAAAGASWNEIFEERLAGPLGLRNTRYALSGPANPRIAGGIESTASEVGRFMEMVRAGGRFQGRRVLSSDSVAELLTRQTPSDAIIVSSPLGSADYGVGIWLDQRDRDGLLVGALAAGARGFSAWIDLDDRMVGVFATDRTTSGNVRVLVDLLRAAAEIAVRDPQPCEPRRSGRRVRP